MRAGAEFFFLGILLFRPDQPSDQIAADGKAEGLGGQEINRAQGEKCGPRPGMGRWRQRQADGRAQGENVVAVAAKAPAITTPQRKGFSSSATMVAVSSVRMAVLVMGLSPLYGQAGNNQGPPRFPSYATPPLFPR